MMDEVKFVVEETFMDMFVITVSATDDEMFGVSFWLASTVCGCSIILSFHSQLILVCVDLCKKCSTIHSYLI